MESDDVTAPGVTARRKPRMRRKSCVLKLNAASRSGFFGAPTILVGKELFWGNDRLESALAWAGASR